MNNNRRKELKKVVKQMEDVKVELERIESDEQDSRDSMIENSPNAENSDVALDKIMDAIVSIEEAIEAIDEII